MKIAIIAALALHITAQLYMICRVSSLNDISKKLGQDNAFTKESNNK